MLGGGGGGEWRLIAFADRMKVSRHGLKSLYTLIPVDIKVAEL